MNPYLINFGSWGIRWYSVFILIGIALSFFIVSKESKRFKVDQNFLFNMAFWTILIGLIGARLYYIVFNWSYYSTNLSEIYKIWHGGLAIHGGIIFGGITMLIYCKKYKVSTLLMCDIVAPALLISQAIGRWGNFFNQEAYGGITTVETLQKLLVPNFIINGMYINGNYYLPMFYFESIWCVIGVIILLLIRRYKYTKIGQIMGTYFIWYSIGRFFIEIYRTDSLMIGGLKVAQLVSVALFLIGLVIILIQSRKPKLEELYNKETVGEIKF